jgi:hypothetical protein
VILVSNPESSKLIRKKTFSYFRKSILTAIILVLLLTSVYLFAVYWDNNAFHGEVNRQYTRQSINGAYLFSITHTVVFENYFPFRADAYNFTISSSSSHRRAISIPNEPESLKAWNLTIESAEFSAKYGESDVADPAKMLNPDTFPPFRTVPMARNVLTIKYSYETNDSSSLILLYFDRNNETGLRLNSQAKILFEQTPLYKMIIHLTPFWRNLSSLLWPAFLCLFIVAAGLFFSWFLFRKNGDLRESYKYLVKVSESENGQLNLDSEKLSKSLRIFTHSPNLLGSFHRIFFGLSLLLFKNSTNRRIKTLRSKCALHCKEELDATLSQYLDNGDSKLADLIPEQRTILLIAGFLTSVGISFSWNAGAAIPFVLSAGLFYVFLNLGASFYLVKSSKYELLWIITVLALVILATLFPQILDLLNSSSTVINR